MQDHGHNWYAATAGEAPKGALLDGDVTFDVAIIGAGYTGLAAALRLAEVGVRVVVLEAHQIGWGASGRNGGQIHPGHRRDEVWLSAQLGAKTGHRLMEIAEEARLWLHETVSHYSMDCELKPGLYHAVHKARSVEETRHEVEADNRAGGSLQWLDKAEISAALSTEAYFGGSYDPKGGHLHALKWAYGLARAALSAGAVIHEQAPVTRIEEGMKIRLVTPKGTVTAERIILAGNGYLGALSPYLDARVMPLNNFIAVTEPLQKPLIPSGAAASDTRFVVYYWRPTPDGRLLFGGGETYTHRFPADIAGFVRGHLARIYPELKDVRLDYAWGGTLGVTLNRLPLVRAISPRIFAAAGYSGQGVMLAPYTGDAVARAMLGDGEDFETLSQMPCPPFPGGPLLRKPTQIAAMSWFALRDRV